MLVVIQNRGDQITTIYDFGRYHVENTQLKRDFLELANQWWWESQIGAFLLTYFLKAGLGKV